MTTVDLSWKLRAQKAEHATRKLSQALKTAKVRLEICLGRFRGCPLVEQGIDAHPVSRAEIPAWIEELESLLSDPAVENILKGAVQNLASLPK